MGCGSCHHLDRGRRRTGQIGPDLDTRLRRPHARLADGARSSTPAQASMMPRDFGDRMSDAELDALVDFLLARPR